MSNILVVDDAALNRVMMMEILKKNIKDVSFLEATNGQEALEQIYEKEIDLVILDLNMPIKDGYEVLKDLKNDNRFVNLPIIVNSSITDKEKVKEALSLGAADYFVKSQKMEDMEVLISTKVNNILNYYNHVKKMADAKNKLENDMNIASIVQRDFLKTKIDFEDIQTYVHYEALNKISGDLFATAKYKGNKWILLVDMKNSSVSSALLSLFFRELFMKHAKFCNSASELMEKLNFEFMKLMSDIDYVFFSAMVVLIKNDKIYVANAGSGTLPYIFSKAFIQEVRANGRMIGVMEDTKYSQVEYDFVKDDMLILCTDGLFSKFLDVDLENIQRTFFHIYDKFYKDDIDAKKLTLNIYNEFLDKENGLKDDLTIACLKKI
jgi:phosphoserine phosphatase